MLFIRTFFVKSHPTPLQSVHTEPLPLMPLLALAMTGFICIVTETLPAGLLPQISTTCL